MLLERTMPPARKRVWNPVTQQYEGAAPRYGDFGDRGPLSKVGQEELDTDVAAMDARWSPERQAELNAIKTGSSASAFRTSAIEGGDRARQEFHDQTMMGRELLVNAPTRAGINRSGGILAQGQAATQTGWSAANPQAAGALGRQREAATARMTTPRLGTEDPYAGAFPANPGVLMDQTRSLAPQPAAPAGGIQWQGETLMATAGRTANVAEADAHIRRADDLQAQAAGATDYMERGKLLDEAGRERQVAEGLRTGMTMTPELTSQRGLIGYKADTGAVVPPGMPGAGHYVGGVQPTPEARVARGETVHPAIIERRAGEKATRVAGLLETEARGRTAEAGGMMSRAGADLAGLQVETLRGMTPEQRMAVLTGGGGAGAETGSMAATDYMDLAKKAREAGNEEQAKFYEQKAAGAAGGVIETEKPAGFTDIAKEEGGLAGAVGGLLGYLGRGPRPGKQRIVPKARPGVAAAGKTVGSILGDRAGPWAGKSIEEFTRAFKANPNDPTLRAIAQALAARGV